MNSIDVLTLVKSRLVRMVRREDGSSTVELAIVFPILLLLFVGTAELGRLFYTYTTLAKATKVGARYLSASRDAMSLDPTQVAAAKLAAQSLVVCGYTNCTGNQPDGSPKVPIVAGLNMNNPAANVSVTLPAADAPVKYVKVEIQGYTFPPGIFNLAGLTGQSDSTVYFPLTPGIEMRYMP
jgi:Flp pilus assembly protein TadG